jgi:hypothetical protein
MALPKDPVMLLSFVNTQLRDNYSGLKELAAAYDIDGTLTVNQGLYLKNSGGNSTFYVESAGDIYGKSLDLSGDINAKTTTVTNLSATSLTVNGNAHTTGTFTVNGLVTLNSGMNITGVLSSSNSCHFEGTSYISGCSFTNGVMDGTATKARYADVAEYSSFS